MAGNSAAYSDVRRRQGSCHGENGDVWLRERAGIIRNALPAGHFLTMVSPKNKYNGLEYEVFFWLKNIYAGISPAIYGET